MRSHFQSSVITTGSILKYRCEHYVVGHCRRFDISTIANIIEGFDFGSMDILTLNRINIPYYSLDAIPSKIVIDALASSLIDIIYTNSLIDSNVLARCLGSSLRWPHERSLPIEIQRSISISLPSHAENIPLPLLVTFVLHRRHKALTIPFIAACFRALSHHAQYLIDEQLCAVCSIRRAHR